MSGQSKIIQNSKNREQNLESSDECIIPGKKKLGRSPHHTPATRSFIPTMKHTSRQAGRQAGCVVDKQNFLREQREQSSNIQTGESNTFLFSRERPLQNSDMPRKQMS